MAREADILQQAIPFNGSKTVLAFGGLLRAFLLALGESVSACTALSQADWQADLEISGELEASIVEMGNAYQTLTCASPSPVCNYVGLLLPTSMALTASRGVPGVRAGYWSNSWCG